MGELRSGNLHSLASPRVSLSFLLFLALVALETACGTGSMNPANTLTPLAVQPAATTVAINNSQTFTTLTNTAVSWTVTGPGCQGNQCGTIDIYGNYDAPRRVPSPAIVTVRATSVANPNVTATSSVNIAASVTVALTPSNASVATGATQQFTASVTGAGDNIVVWSLSGPGCLATACGTISGGGLYTAPSAVPNPPTVTVKATSLAAPTVSATAAVQLTGPQPVAMTVSPTSVQLQPGAQQLFNANVTGSSNKSVTWSVAGAGCVSFLCGTVAANGLYTAPATAPNPPLVSVTATSNADPSKSATATVNLGSGLTVTVTPANVELAPLQTQLFQATVNGGTQAVNWSLSGPGCAGSTCGTISSSGLYSAPATAPNPATVTVTARLASNPSSSGSAQVTIVPAISVSVAPSSAHVGPGLSQQFSATVLGTPHTVVAWSLSGPGCSGVSCGQISATGLYTAPLTIPSPNNVTVTATLVSSPHSATATVFVGTGTPVTTKITPASASVLVAASQQFTATVTGSTNTNVTWSIQGIGCSGSSCGTISQAGLYVAPSNVPIPSYVNIVATPQAAPSSPATAVANILPNVTVAVSPTSASVTANQQRQFTASVTGASNANVIWSLSGAGCAGPSCGVITSSGLYTAPAVVPSPATVTVTVTSQADHTKSASASVTVVVPITVSVSPSAAQLTTGSSQQFAATVGGTSNTAVTWSLSGSGCSGSACGIIGATGLYKAPGTVPSPPTITVTATAQADNRTASFATVTVVPKTDTKLTGQYAFSFEGFDSQGAYLAIGSFIADGLGNVVSGVEDINRAAGPVKAAAFTGNYVVNGDNRGTITFTGAEGTSTYAFALGASGKAAHFIETDLTGTRGSGIFELQNPSAFATNAIFGGYTVSLAGVDSAGGRIAGVASIFPSGSGIIAGSSLDVNDNGNVPSPFTSFTGTYNVAANGRGTLTLDIPFFGSGTFNFAFYVISQTELFLISTDPVSSGTPAWAGRARQQSGSPYSNASLNGFSVFYESGLLGSSPDVAVGRYMFDGQGNVVQQIDENRGGAIFIGDLWGGTYQVAPNGRTTLTLVNAGNGQNKTLTFYLVSPNEAFLLDGSGTVMAGYSQAQVVQPPFGDADFAGTYTFGALHAGASLVPLISGEVAGNGNGQLEGNQDQTLVTGFQTGLLIDGTYVISSVSKNGRGVLQPTSPVNTTYAIWLVSYSKGVAISVDSSDLTPVIVVYEQ
jgi:hypothetical protein